MTTPKPLTLAGILFIVAGLAILVPILSEQTPHQDRSTAVTIALAVGGILVSSAALTVAYVALYVARPRGGAHWLFLLAALGFAVELLRFVIPAGGFFGEFIALVGTIAAGIYVVVRKSFTLVPSLIFLVTAVFGLVPFMLLGFASATAIENVVEDVGFALYVVCGVAMILGARAIARPVAVATAAAPS